MATLNLLTDRKVKGIKPALLKSRKKTVMVADGGGLYFVCKKRGRNGAIYQGWSFKRQVQGKRREWGLGAYPDVSLAVAREIRKKFSDAISKGDDPSGILKPAADRKTFGECMDIEIQHRSGDWKGGTASQTAIKWRATRNRHAASLMKMDPDGITRDDAKRVLDPIWVDMHPTAEKVRQHLEGGFDRAAFLGLTEKPNPFRWKGNLENMLPRHKHKTENHPALPYTFAPALARAALEESEEYIDGGVPLMLFLILASACRMSEARLAREREFDQVRRVWVVPPDNEKVEIGREVPLPDAVWDRMQFSGDPDAYMFRSERRNRPWTDGRPLAHLRRLLKRSEFAGHERCDVHGLRSTYKTHAQDKSDLPDQVSEAVLGHVVGDKVRRAYARSKYFEQQREQLAAWADYLLSGV